MKAFVCTGLMGVMLSAGAASALDVYTDEGAFLAQVDTFYLEDFDWAFYGGYTELTWDGGPVNGYAYTLSCFAGADGGSGDFLLWTNDGAMSTNSALDGIRADFTGDPVYAVGGWFYASDFNGFYQPGETIIGLADGTSYPFMPGNGTDFRGFVSDIPIAWMTVDAPDGAALAWPAMDPFYVGNLIPAPTTAALFGLAGLTTLRRRR